ncbi:sulfate transporter family protein [Sphingobium sp. SYK-6]|uniref:SulP family inorganic anion transporter n=1 Tax=Sphingobium sp. (strain NBRC 103272 / SYK-6) TaxID=627192 RepID=UPI000227737F|nr:SulP family inorganic anion transporter [Sphingobium sp. SYK-6]BAK67673.1 sulfate transporter family protein [Sphingobium sp. SYK-6]
MIGALKGRSLGGGAEGGTFTRDFTASIVVFLVAMPLCMGIAIASGVPAEKGLITGIIGGIIVGFLAGSPLQVSGPAAGLAVIVFEFVREHGLAALGPVLLLAGLLQFVAGMARMGGFFRSVSPAVVHGMLAGIGALIVVGQFHILFDNQPMSSGLENIALMPARVLGLSPFSLQSAEYALLLGLVTIGAMVGWEKLRPASMKLVPGALLGVVAATLIAWIAQLDVTRIDVPASIVGAIDAPGTGFLAPLTQPALLVAALAIAFIASAETLLSAAAVDRMHDGVRTDYNKELRAQGVGNLLCGLAGALPMTGVIVRSSANVQAGAKTRWSAILHGIWILGFVALLPGLLREIPMAALGGVLVVTGWRLVSLTHVRHLFANYGILPAAIWAVTFILVVTTDLLTGVLVGLGLSVIELIQHRKTLRLKVEEERSEEISHLRLDGSATFVSLTRLTQVLESIPREHAVELDLHRLHGIDHTSTELMREWVARRKATGKPVTLLGPDHLVKRLAFNAH